MRKQLAKLDQQRLRFRAQVERLGQKTNYKGWPEDTILLKNVYLISTGQQVTDHLWFTVGKTLKQLNLQPGEILEFDARVNPYTKGYVNHREGIDERTLDYKLTRPTQFKKVAGA